MARNCYAVSATAAVFLSAIPVSDCVVLLWLLIAAEVGVALALLDGFRDRVAAPAPIVSAMRNIAPTLPLSRRIVPQLRAQRPIAVTEAQLRWRRAAASRRAARSA